MTAKTCFKMSRKTQICIIIVEEKLLTCFFRNEKTFAKCVHFYVTHVNMHFANVCRRWSATGQVPTNFREDLNTLSFKCNSSIRTTLTGFRSPGLFPCSESDRVHLSETQRSCNSRIQNKTFASPFLEV